MIPYIALLPLAIFPFAWSTYVAFGSALRYWKEINNGTTGLLGGISMVAGCAGLIILKWRANPAASDPKMAVRDYGLLTSLLALAISGFLVLALRASPLYGLVLLVHLALVLGTFTVASYTKFTHFVFRFLSLVKDNFERLAA